MTIVVSVKAINGIVIAVDSVGDSAGDIGSGAFQTLWKDLQRRFSGRNPTHAEWQLDPAGHAA